MRDIDVEIFCEVFQSGYDAVLELIAIKRFGWDVSFGDANVRFQLLKLAYKGVRVPNE